MKILDVILKENHEVREGARKSAWDTFKSGVKGAATGERELFIDNWLKQYAEYASKKKAAGVDAYDDFETWFNKERMKDPDLQRSKYALDPDVRSEMAKRADSEVKATHKERTKLAKDAYWDSKWKRWEEFFAPLKVPGAILKWTVRIGLVLEPFAVCLNQIGIAFGVYGENEETINQWFTLGTTPPDFYKQLADAGIDSNNKPAVDNFIRTGKLVKSSQDAMYKWISDAELQNSRVAKAQIEASFGTMAVNQLLTSAGAGLIKRFAGKFVGPVLMPIWLSLSKANQAYVVWKIQTDNAKEISDLIWTSIQKNPEYPWTSALGVAKDVGVMNYDRGISDIFAKTGELIKSLAGAIPQSPAEKFKADYEKKAEDEKKAAKEKASKEANPDTTSTTGEAPTTNTPQPEQNPDQYASTTSPSAATDKKYGEPGYVSKDGLFTLLHGDNDKGYAWKYNKLPNKFTHTEPGQEPDPKSIR